MLLPYVTVASKTPTRGTLSTRFKQLSFPGGCCNGRRHCDHTYSFPRCFRAVSIGVVVFLLPLFVFGQAGMINPPVGNQSNGPEQSIQHRSLAVGFWPGVSLPLQPEVREIINPAAGGSVGFEYRLPQGPLFFGLDAMYSGLSLPGFDTEGANKSDISSFSGFARVGWRFSLAPRLQVTASGFAGAGLTMVKADISEDYGPEAVAPGYGATLGLDVPLTDLLAVGIRAGYMAHSNTYHGILLSAGTVISLPRGTRAARTPAPQDAPRPAPLTSQLTIDFGDAELQLTEIRFDSVFPVFYHHYEYNPMGSASLTNTGTREITNVSVRLNIPRFMDVARTLSVPPTLAPGESAEIDLYALFTDEIMRVTEGTRVAAILEISYRLDGQRQTYTLDRSVEVVGRNAMTWDDDRKAASFVTTRDPVVMTLARNVASMVRGSEYDSINMNIRNAIAMAEAIVAHGVNYVIDPISPYAELSENPQALDFLQFPIQTLEHRAADCDGLSILYAALLEAVGVPVAFITVPGHIFVAFSTGLTLPEASLFFSRTDELIVHNDEVWVPVEVTVLDDGFVYAWQAGAKQWREQVNRGQAAIFPIAEAWEVYPAVGLPDGPTSIPLPSMDAVKTAYQNQLVRFIDREIFPQVSRLQNQIAGSSNEPRHINRLGVLYARYGLIERALNEFSRITRGSRPFPPALLNVGNLHYLAKDISTALEYYTRAQQLNPDSTVVLLALARANHELENYGTVVTLYSRLREMDPDLADRFAYLDFRGEEARRAAQISDMSSIVVWDE